MMNISLSHQVNPMKPDEEKKYYGRVQYTDTLSLEQFSEHVAAHNSKYDGADIFAVMKISARCLQELIKQGYKVSLGDMGAFYPSISCSGADSMEDFSEDNIRNLTIKWDRPKKLDNIKEGVSFKKVPSRAIQAAIMKSVMQGNSAEVLEYVNALQANDSAITPDEGSQPDGDDSEGGSTSGGGSNNPDPNA